MADENLGALSIDNWATQLRKGVLELYIINILNQGELYAYDLVKRLTGTRGLVISDGTVYPLLSRMRKAGLLRARLEESPEGAVRKYYTLTDEGKRIRALMNAYWDGVVQELRHAQEESEVPHGRMDAGGEGVP